MLINLIRLSSFLVKKCGPPGPWRSLTPDAPAPARPYTDNPGEPVSMV